MKRTTKIFMTATLSVATVLSVSPVFASNEAPASPNSTPIPGIITPYAVQNPISNLTLSGKTFDKSFDIPAHYGWVKIWVNNTSSETLRVRVTQGTLTGTQKMSFEVAPGQSVTQFGTQPWSTGDHWVAISTKDGGNMSGQLSVKLATTKEEL